jgi:hypothetical protein
MKEDWSSEENVWRCTGLRSTRGGRTTSSSTQHLIAAPIDVGFFVAGGKPRWLLLRSTIILEPNPRASEVRGVVRLSWLYNSRKQCRTMCANPFAMLSAFSTVGDWASRYLPFGSELWSSH